MFIISGCGEGTSRRVVCERGRENKKKRKNDLRVSICVLYEKKFRSCVRRRSSSLRLMCPPFFAMSCSMPYVLGPCSPQRLSSFIMIAQFVLIPDIKKYLLHVLLQIHSTPRPRRPRLFAKPRPRGGDDGQHFGAGTGWLMRIGPVSDRCQISMSYVSCPSCQTHRVMSHVGFLDSPNVIRVMSDLRSHVGCTLSQSALHEPPSLCF